MYGLDFKNEYKKDVQVQDIRKETHYFQDQSVKQTLCQAYAVDLTNHTEDITEMKKNFKNNISATASSTQDNIVEFHACLELTDYNLEQSNKLVQDVEQGFDQFEKDVKELKRLIDTQSDTEIKVDQGANSKQDGQQEGEQKTDGSQDSKQESQQESFRAKFRRRSRFNDNILDRTDMYRDYMRELGEAKINEYRNNMTIEKMRKSPINIVRNFARFAERYLVKARVGKKQREKFCLFGCIDVQHTHQESEKIMKDVQIDTKELIQTQDIYESISTAYNKCIETIIKISEEVEKVNDTHANAVSSQINIVSIKTPEDACMLKLKNINIKQTNELNQNVALTVVLESITNLTSDVVVKAIMSDMMGLTQKGEAEQVAKQKSKQGSVLKQVSTQSSKQASSDTGGMIAIILIVVVIVMFLGPMMGGMGGSYHDSYFDGPVVVNNYGTGMMGPGAMRPGMGPATHNFMNRATNMMNTAATAMNMVNGVRQPMMNQPMMNQPMQQPMNQPYQQPMQQPSTDYNRNGIPDSMEQRMY
jgi:hypothetical protein